jgi:hypothetical protein
MQETDSRVEKLEKTNSPVEHVINYQVSLERGTLFEVPLPLLSFVCSQFQNGTQKFDRIFVNPATPPSGMSVLDLKRAIVKQKKLSLITQEFDLCLTNAATAQSKGPPPPSPTHTSVFLFFLNELETSQDTTTMLT